MARRRRRPTGIRRRSSRGCAGTSAPAVARDILRLAIIGVWAAEPRDVSLLHVLFYIRSAGSIEILTDTEGGAQQDRIVGGSQLISLRMAEELGRRRGRARGAGPADRLRRRRRRGRRATALTVRARRAIVAVPPTLAGRIAYDPPLPADPRRPLPADGPGQRRQVHGRSTSGRSGATAGSPGAVTSVTGPVSVGFDNSPPDGSPGVLLGFLEGRAAREAMDPAAGRAPGDRRRAASRRFFGPEAADPVGYVDRAWAADEWSRGCYGGFMPPGAWSDNGPALRAPIGPIHWAGSRDGDRLERLHGRRRRVRARGRGSGSLGPPRLLRGYVLSQGKPALYGTMDSTLRPAHSRPRRPRAAPTAAPPDRS